MATILPDDLLHMICGCLAEQKDFRSLYQCACSGKQLAVPALACLYRIHNESPVIGSASEENALSRREKSTATAKWANLWRSIVLSCLGKTLFDYAHFVRELDFDDLGLMLQDASFWTKTSPRFFAGDMQQFKNDPTFRKSGTSRFDGPATTSSIALFLTQHTPMLEKLKGNLNKEILDRCLPLTPHLRRLRVYEGHELAGTEQLISKHCPEFIKIGFYGWSGANADMECASFLSGIRPQTLQSFQVFGTTAIGAESFPALNLHSDTLKTLKVVAIGPNEMQHLSKFKDCTNIEKLKISENHRGTQDLEHRQNDVFEEMVEWLCQCKALRIVSLVNFISGPALLTPFLRTHDTKLTSLELDHVQLSESSKFHSALSLQKQLKSLSMGGEESETVRDNDALVESLSKLVQLTNLRLTQVSASFTEHHIRTLARNLPNLETFETWGFHITDGIWPDIAKLLSLKTLDLNADTRFTANGILDFVYSLDSGNHGFTLNIMMQDTDHDISEKEQEMIRNALASQLEGKLFFLLVRGPEEDGQYSSEDSD